MRLIGRALILLAMAAAGVWITVYWEAVRPPKTAGSGDDRINGATRAPAYVLPREGWLVFPVDPAADRMFRLLTNADVTAAQAREVNAVIEYTLEYQMIDREGATLDSVQHVHRTRVSHFEDKGNPGSVQFGSFYLDSDRVPADGRIVLVNFARLTDTAELRVRLVGKQGAVVSAIVRAYQRERPPDYKLANRWERLSDDRRKMLSRGNVYDHEFLSREEKLALVRYRWNPVAPLGVADVDFYRHMVYIREADAYQQVREPVIPYGVIVDAAMNGIIALPQSPDGIDLEFEPIESAGPLQVKIGWRGDESQRREQAVIDVIGPVTRLRLHYDEPGLAEITANGAVAVRASAPTADGGSIDLTPRPSYLRTYLVERGQDIDYDITQAGDGSTPLRIDARVLLAPNEDAAELDLSVALLSGDGELVANLPCHIAVTATAYDRVRLPVDDPRRLSEPASCYTLLPRAATHIRLSAERALLTNAYTRPPALIKEVEVPDDYISFQNNRVRLPTWFYLRPRDRMALARRGRSVQVVVQSRPKDEDQDVLAGRYRWDEFQPAGDWAARYVLNPRDSRLPLRDQALAVVFRSISATRAQTLEFRGAPGQRTLVPRIIFAKSDADEFAVSVMIDDRPVANRRLRGTRGEFLLPPVVAGRHTLRVTSDHPADWYINYVAADGNLMVRRLAIRLGQPDIRFGYRKEQPTEVITGHLQVPFGASEPVRLRVSIVPVRPRDAQMTAEWSVLERRYVIHPDNSDSVVMLGGSEARLERGRRFFVPVKADLPPGDYEIKIWLENAAKAYLTLYRLTPGLYKRDKLFREHSVVEASE